MTAMEYIIIGMPSLAGLLMVFRVIDCAMDSGEMRRAAHSIGRWHQDVNRALIDKGFLRFPGIRLVSSLKPWIAGYLLLIFTTILVLSLHPSRAYAILAVVAGLFAGAFAWYLALKEEARKMLDSVRSSLPVASFLLSLMLEAGVGSAAAIQDVIKALPAGPLPEELGELDRLRKMGAPRAGSMEKSRARIPLDDYRSFLNLIQQGERMGISLSQGLRDLSGRIMESQGHRAEAIAQKAAVKLLFPLVIFIFPSVFLVILSPVILNLWEMLGR